MTVPIGRVYSLFAAESDRLFRATMWHSSGGVVCVIDLLRVLVDAELSAVRELLPDNWKPVDHRPPDNRPLIPASNEPALRQLLQTAYEIAVAQVEGIAEKPRPQITPAVFWAAIFLEQQVPMNRPLAEIFGLLGLRFSESLQRKVAIAKPLRPSPAPRRPALKPVEVSALISEVLNRWLDVQQLPIGEEKEQELTEIATLTQRVQMAPMNSNRRA